jgi:hypothetical protein
MTLRLAIIGNCHAQYFGAALETLPGIEVRTVGLAYPGPINFERKLPTFIHSKHVQKWLDAGEHGLILHQVTADTRLDLYDRITSNRPYPLIRFPYVKFHALVAEKATPEAIETDRRYNAGSFLAAGYPMGDLDRLEALAQKAPILFEYNHFAGAGFAVLFDAIIRAGLEDYIPRADLDDLLQRMEKDRGISHSINPIQRARFRSPLSRRMNEPVQVWREALAEPVSPISAHSLFKTAAGHYRETGRAAYMGILLTLYRQQLHQTWAEIIVDLLVERKRVGLAMLILGRRMGWEDARGCLLAKALKLAVDIRRSPTAYSALHRFAAKYPDSTLPLLLQCCTHIRH